MPGRIARAIRPKRLIGPTQQQRGDGQQTAGGGEIPDEPARKKRSAKNRCEEGSPSGRGYGRYEQADQCQPGHRPDLVDRRSDARGTREQRDEQDFEPVASGKADADDRGARAYIRGVVGRYREEQQDRPGRAFVAQ